MKLDLTSWKRALASLERAITRSIAAPNDEELRDAVIQPKRRRVYQSARSFITDASSLLAELERRNVD